MLDIEPPEVPAGLITVSSHEKSPKQGFFKRLFSAKKPEQADDITPSTLDQALPELPPLEVPKEQDEWAKKLLGPTSEPLPKKVVGKGKGKKSKDKKIDIAPFDSAKNFNWTSPIADQDPIIRDSNRDNDEVNKLIAASEQHVDDIQSSIMNAPDSVGIEVTQTGLLTPNVPESISDVLPKAEQESANPLAIADVTIVHPEEQKVFNELDKQHQKLRDKLTKKIQDKDFAANKKEFMQLLRDYDERIEHKIERKQMEFSTKHKRLDVLKNSLHDKAHELAKLHASLKTMEKAINEKESKIDNVISSTVTKQVDRRVKKERLLLNKGLKDTIALNNKLKKKLDVLERDRIMFDKKKDKLLCDERKKITASQMMYENKLKELSEEKDSLDMERKAFEEEKALSLAMLKKAGEISTELKEMQRLKDLVQNDKNLIDKEIVKDKELKMAIDSAEARIAKEKHDLDNMIFSKYIEWKLNSSPGSLLDMSTFKEEIDNMYKNNKVYPMIDECKRLLLKRKMFDAKVLYNKIKTLFETSELDNIEKTMIYNSLRALYNEIRLAELTRVDD